MQKIFYSSLLLLTVISGSRAMTKIASKDPLNVLYNNAKMCIALLQKKAERGDMVSMRAVHDFCEKMKNPQYKIWYPPAIELLQSLALLDSKAQIRDAIREAFKKFDSQR